MIQRNIFQALLDHLLQPEITVITGPRQVGKTTLMRMMAENLSGQGKPVLFLQLENENDFKLLSSQASLVSRIREVSATDKVYAFIDEIQLKKNAGSFLKGIYDMDYPFKFIISGSGSMELHESIIESMAGRKRIFEVMPVSFFEFADFRSGYRHTDGLASFLMQDQQFSLNLLNEYLNFGGYPGVIMAPTIQAKLDMINEIYTSYVIRDIHTLLKGHGPEVYGRMMSLLAAQTGGMINFSMLANETNAALPTIRKYLWFAERTFFLKMIPPLYGNKIKEITKSPVVYFTDHGMRNYVNRMFGTIQNHRDYGFAFQNLVCTMLLDTLQRHLYDLHFWRTINKAEVDFVVQRHENPLPVEVKYSAMRKPEITRSLRSFIDHYNPSDAWVINLTLSSTVVLNNTTVHFIPLFRIQSYLSDLRTEPEKLYRVSEKVFAYRLLHTPSPGKLGKRSLYSR